MIKTQQTIQDYQSAASAHPKWSEDAIEDYQGLKGDVDVILSNINDGMMSPQSGSGSPEGIIYTNYSLLYVDTDVDAIYFNPDFNSQTGWVILSVGGSGSVEAIISLSLSATTGAFDTTYTLCPLDVTEFSSGIGDYTISGGVITVINAGTYEISYDCSIDEQAGNNRTEFVSSLFIASLEATGTAGFMYSRNAAQGAASASCRVIKTLSASDTVEMRVKRNSGSNTGEFIGGGNRLLMRKIST